KSAREDTKGWEIIPLRIDVGNVECAMLANPTIPWLFDTHLEAATGYWYGTKMTPRNHSIALTESQRHVIDPTNPGRALDNGIEDRLYVRRRAADDAKHLRCRCLMLQGLPQFCVALLDLFEESHVFDGDHCLIGERFQESNLLFGEWTNFSPANQDSPNRSSLTKQRSSKNRSRRIRPLQWSRVRIVAVKVFRDIIHVNGLSVQNGPSGWSKAI